jgi:class 3 adenylate cyclase
MSLLFAATYPQRTAGLVLFGSYASMRAEPWVVEPALFAAFLHTVEKGWGQGVLVALNAPSRASDEPFMQWWGRLERASASPGAILALFRANYEIDVRDILPSIRVPTLIMHRVGDAMVPVTAGRHLAHQIPGAKYVELPGEDHLIQTLDQDLLDRVLDEIEEFITGSRRRPEPDRTLATLMFVDVVGSTERAVALGDRRWREVLEEFFTVVRRELGAYRGREVKSTGDGVLATFDGPARAIRCACSIRERLRPLQLRVRVGVHTGECELLGDDVGGIAVHIAARVAAAAGADEVLVSSTVKDLVAGSQMAFVDRGAHELKGVPGHWQLHAVA